jgi:nucleotide-binding universal stress UspA family protein
MSARGLIPKLDRMQEVVIGYEPTPQGEDALALGAMLCKVLVARPLIATALPFSSTAMGWENLEESLEVDTSEMLAVARDRLSDLDPVSRAVASRSPADGLTRLAEETDALLIVVGSCHRGPIGRVVFGSTTEQLMRRASAPVAVAPRDFATRASKPLLRFAVAYDGSIDSVRALETGIALAERTHGSLSVLHAVEPLPLGYGTRAALVAGEDPFDKREILEEGPRRVPAGLSVTGRLLDGEPSREIAKAARDYDLLVLGSQGHGPLLRIALGNVSGPLARQAPCPIMVLPRGARAIAAAAPSSVSTVEGE